MFRTPPAVMQPTFARAQLGGLVPPKIASPNLVVRSYSTFAGSTSLTDAFSCLDFSPCASRVTVLDLPIILLAPSDVCGPLQYPLPWSGSIIRNSACEQSGGSGAALRPLVAFYSKLPKGEATAAPGGLKKFFVGRNATAKPLLALIVGLWTIGYTIDYQSALTCRNFRIELTFSPVDSAPQYVFSVSCDRGPC